ncbi:flagellar hook-basal body complex protein [Lysinibacillus sp. 54212]|uniref:flagellar hook-basal body complex protein n=1 Tax=Lysinibacillus sp. 54212 TaxID=3119829 RepID=UPI002FC6EC3B
MLRSMYSGISGLRNFQTKLDVIGNNISNVNTYGFKKGRTVFKDLISQTQSGASGTSQTRGGTNAKQIGLGSQLAAIDTIHGNGALQNTGRTLDLGLAGEGFFMVADSEAYAPGTPPTPGAATGTENIAYTRAGNFYMNSDGYLINSDGKYLVGYANTNIDAYDSPTGGISNFDTEKDIITPGASIYDPTTGTFTTFTNDVAPIRIPTTAQSYSIGQDGVVSFTDAEGKLQYAGTIILAKFPNAEGLEKMGSNYFRETQNSGDIYVQAGTQDGLGKIESGFLEMSNVDLSEEFTEMIVAQRGFQANTRIITTSDEILQELVNLKR